MTQRTSTPKTVELWIQSFAPATVGPAQERALEHVDALESRAEIAGIDVGVWGKAIEQTDRIQRVPQIRTIEARLEAFDEWAARAGRSLEPFFRTRRVESTITGSAYEVRRLPTVAVAEYRGDELVHVAPCCDGDRVIDALERLEELVRGDEDEQHEQRHAFDGDDGVNGRVNDTERDGRDHGQSGRRPESDSRRLQPPPGPS